MISVEGVHKTYRNARKKEQVHAVQGVNFQCQPGRVFALLGPNGSGKTTLLRMVATLMKPDKGRVMVAGMDAGREGLKVRERLGFLTGSARLHEKLTAAQVLEYFGKLHGLGGRELQSRTSELVDRLEIGEFLTRPTGKLSMGQKQRVMIARTLIHDPEVVVFDEATAGLDVLAAKALADMVRDCRDAGKTVVFSTHIMGEVAMLADDVTVIHHGSQVFTGTFSEFKAQQQEVSLEEEFVRLLMAKEGGAQ